MREVECADGAVNQSHADGVERKHRTIGKPKDQDLEKGLEWVRIDGFGLCNGLTKCCVLRSGPIHFIVAVTTRLTVMPVDG